MFITGIGAAAPTYRYTNNECWKTLQGSSQLEELTPRSRAILQKVLNSGHGEDTRSLALPSLDEAFDNRPDVLHERFARTAPDLATAAAHDALTAAGLRAADMDAVIISTCTGYLCPGLTSYVIERLGLKSDIIALDLVGQGCGAALPNMRTGEAFLAAGRCRNVLSICVEVCSAAFYLDNDPGVLISACLFGDGAGAAVLSNKPGARSIEWKGMRSITNPADRDVLRFEWKDGLLRNILSLQVPELAAVYARGIFCEALDEAGLSPEDIRTFIWHPGGRHVLDALAKRLGLPEEEFRWSRAILDEYGNLSSASVYFVLKAALEGNAPAGHWWMSSFGAGFTCHGALLEVGA